MNDSVSFDRIADKFDSTRAYPEDTWNAILEALSGVLSEKGLILDAGVDTGRFAAPLQAKGLRIVGVDISARMLEKAKAKRVQNILQADLCALPFRDHRFSDTISIHVLHLIKRWKCALGEIGRVTTHRFISVAFVKEPSDAETIRDFYDQVCNQLGFVVHHPGVRERELPDLLSPDSEKLIATLERPVDVTKLIDDYEARVYSAQWPVPEDVHQQAVQAMRERFKGLEQVLGKERIVLMEWDIKRIRKFSKGTEPYST